MAGVPRAGRRVLVAGIGNIFFGDDGFGVEVIRRLAQSAPPAHVTVADYGIRGLHLAYAMLEGGYDRVIFVDALPQREAPGTLVAMVPDPATLEGPPDAHAMTPAAVLALLRTIGGSPPEIVIVGCEPASIEPGIGLSPEAEASVDRAVRMVWDYVDGDIGKGDACVPCDSGAARRVLA